MIHNVHSLALGSALALAACGGATSSNWDPKSSESLRAQSQAILHDLDAGDFDAMLALVDDDSIVLDLDENNHPVRFQGRDKVTGYFRNLEKAAKSQGLKFKSTIAKNDCSATDAIGYCVLEFDQTISAGGHTMGPFKFRATIVSRKVGSQWKWAHWHGSFREMPEPPAAVSTTATTGAAK